MNHPKEYIEELLERFIEGLTDEKEEQTLSEFFENNDNIPEEWQFYSEMFRSFKTDAYDFSTEELNDMLKPESRKRSRMIIMWTMVSAACVAAIMLFVIHHSNVTTKFEMPQIAEIQKNPVAHKPDTTTVPKPADDIVVEENVKSYVALNEDKKNKTVINKKEKEETEETEGIIEEPKEITTAELVETIDNLDYMTLEDFKTITIVPNGGRFIIKASYTNGQSNSFTLKRCSDGSSIEVTQQYSNL